MVVKPVEEGVSTSEMRTTGVVKRHKPSSRMTGPERRQDIVNKTLRVIAEHGLQGATTARIAAAVGVSEKTLYSHFESKEALLIAALDQIFDEARGQAVFCGDSEDTIENLRSAHASHRVAKGEFVYPLFEFFASSHQENLRDELRSRHETSIRLMIEMIEEGKKRGAIREDADSEQTAWDVMAVYWADDVAYMLGFDVGKQTGVMMERIIRDITP